MKVMDGHRIIHKKKINIKTIKQLYENCTATIHSGKPSEPMEMTSRVKCCNYFSCYNVLGHEVTGKSQRKEKSVTKIIYTVERS